MFEVDWSNADTLLLNLTNLGLGILLAAALAWAVIDVIIDLAGKWRREARVSGLVQRSVTRGRWHRPAIQKPGW